MAEAGPRGVSVAAHGRAARHNAGALHLHVLQALSSGELREAISDMSIYDLIMEMLWSL